FHVEAKNAANTNSTTATPRRVPVTSMPARARSTTTGILPESRSATTLNVTASSHAAIVLQTVILSLAAMSAALVSGRLAVNGVGVLSAAAANAAMNGGVNSTTNRIRNTIGAVSLPGTNSSRSSNGTTTATIAGSVRPCRRHSNHVCARAGERKRGAIRLKPDAIVFRGAKSPRQSGLSPRRARPTAYQATRYAKGICGAQIATIT